MRYAWLFFDEYFGNINPLKKVLISNIIQRLKIWDLKTNETVDFFIAISDNVKKRIKDFYAREADVIYPPVETQKFSISEKDDNFYLIVSALVPYKKIDIAIEAFNSLNRKLIVIGTGNSEAELKRIAGPNIEFLGWMDDEGLKSYYESCSALIFPGEEDFGIVPLEAQACGKSVIAYAKGGALETIIPINPQPTTYDLQPMTHNKPTGVFFYEQTPGSLAEAVGYFESVKDGFNPQALRENALQFDRKIFKQNIKEYISSHINT
jgi:glycosyltransferase involved in cell wall biosynthesis